MSQHLRGGHTNHTFWPLTTTDENRARVVAGNQLGRIVSLLGDDSILAFVIPVLYNICVDYGMFSTGDSLIIPSRINALPLLTYT